MKEFIIKIANYRLFQHVMFWLSYVLGFGIVYGKFGNDYPFYFLESLGMVPFVMASTYLTIYLILPNYLKKQNFLLSLIYFLGTLVLICTLQRMFLRYINDLQIRIDKLYDLSFLSLFLETNFMVGIAMAIKLIKIWFDQQKEKFEIEKRTLQSELNLLKAQIHPHFLFNTMNNLYALSIGQSGKTSEGIAKVSDLLRAVLYDCNEAFIDMDKEIALIRNYIDLQALRYDNRLSIDFSIVGEPQGIRVAPMLYLTFIENCFKHGSANDPGDSWIRILLRISDHQIHFVAENSKPPVISENAVEENRGIGLENVRKRLKILYKNNHQLKISESDTSYKVDLVLNALNVE
jgi:sensor histidine kinase YesM